jgi:hypothetical protein
MMKSTAVLLAAFRLAVAGQVSTATMSRRLTNGKDRFQAEFKGSCTAFLGGKDTASAR